MAQERRANDGGLAASRSVRRFGGVAARRCLRQLHGTDSPRSRGIPRALSSERTRQSPLEALGGAWTSDSRSRAADAWGPEPLEPGQGPFLGTVAARVGGRGGLR